MSHDIKSDLRAAAAAVYRASQPKLLLSQVLIERMTQAPQGQLVAAEIDCSTACSMVGMPESALLQLLYGDPCLRAYQTVDGNPGQLSISLDQYALQRAARGSASGHRMPGVPAPPYVQYNGLNGMQQQQYVQPMYRYPGPPPPQLPPQYSHQQYQPHLQYQQYMAPVLPQQQQMYNPHAYPAGPYPPHAGVQMQAPPPRQMPPSNERAGQAIAVGPNGSISSTPGGLHSSTPGLSSSRGSSRSSSQTGGPSSSGMAGGHVVSQPNSTGGQMGLQHNQLGGQMGSQQTQSDGQLGPQSSASRQYNPQPQLQQAGEGMLSAQVAAGAPQEGLVSPTAGPTAVDSSASSTAPNAGKALLAKLQTPSAAHAAGGPHGNSAAADPAAAASSSSSSNSSSGSKPAAGQWANGAPVAAQGKAADGQAGSRAAAAAASNSGSSSRTPAAGSQGGLVIDPKGVYLRGIPGDMSAQELKALFADVGSIKGVDIRGGTKQPGTTACAFVNFNEEASAQQVLPRKFIKVGERSVQVLPKTVGRVQQQQAAQGQQAGASSSQGAAAGAGAKQNQRLLGRNEEGLPQLRGAACCPFYMGTGQCKFRNACKYHHPSHALHPECVAAGRNPQRYAGDMPSYARLVNFTERLWDYGSCVEAQLKIWLARHLIASENSGCGMFDESAAVPAAPEYQLHPDESQPLGPYSCPLEKADQVLQVLWKAQPDEAAKHTMPYQGRVDVLLGDDPYYELGPETQGKRSWVQLSVGSIKGLLNF